MILVFSQHFNQRLITILQWFLPYIDMSQPWVYMCLPVLNPPPTSFPIPSLWVFPVHQSEETRSERDTCTPMFVTALFIIARTWKQPRCPSADEWIRKLWYIYTMECYSAIKKNSFESVLMRWMKLEPIIQSAVNL